MGLLVTYILIMAAASTGIAYFCVVIEQWTSPFTSLLVFFVLFFSGIWAAWVASVWLTRVKAIQGA
jgi:hypothetical protein